ncbi:large conductance mechanosensitive channel protein MscL [Deinococcus radiomollis]|uniref:large conductance mechanosensitive channel protein MscL n=1 Tax=Deinococcus radiomollis TaxID=468916 RepID=UPI003891D1B7
MINGFRAFVLRGNVVDLAVGVVTGAAFAALIAAFGTAFLNPLIRLVSGGGKVGGSFYVNGVEFPYGTFVTAVITFLLTMTVVYFAVVVPMTAAVNRLKREDKPAIAQPSNEEKLLVEIRDALRSR